MRANALKALWRAGKTALNIWLAIPSSVSAELIAQAGPDACTIDMQHGIIDYQVAVTMLQAISTTQVVPLVRVPWNEPGIIMKALDAGAYGIIAPMINNRADAERFVGACRYAPAGYRSVGPQRAAMYAGVDPAGYVREADANIVTLAMIETKEALDNLEAIAATPGLDGLYIGPSDLHLAMTGRYETEYTDGPVYNALLRIRDAARAAGIVPCMHSVISSAYARKMTALGFSMVTVGNEALLMTSSARTRLAEVRA